MDYKIVFSDHQELEMHANTIPLPPEEWDFELEEPEVLLAFYYEYGRSSDTIKSEAQKMRDARPKPHFWPYCPRENPHFEIIFWLAEREEFPEIPWLVLKQNAILRVRQRRAGLLQTEQGSVFKPGYKIVFGRPTKLPDDPVEPIEWMVRMFKGFNGIRTNLRGLHIGCQHVWHGDSEAEMAWRRKLAGTFVPSPQSGTVKPNPDFSTFEFCIPWRMSDKEILNEMKMALESHRPKEFKGHAKTRPEVQLGFDDNLPFRKDTALKWLGILRRFKSANESWQSFLELYDPEAKQKIDIGERDFVTWRDNQMVKRDNALNVLKWFETGLPEYIAHEKFQ
jgi:hypothetical protein